MGGVNVKNTIVEHVLDVVAPHLCFGCQKRGSILCDNCKYDIIHEPFLGCILCERPNRSGVCPEHSAPFTKAFVVSYRQGVLQETIDAFKFQRAKRAGFTLATLLNQRLPLLPFTVSIVPVPTVRSHIRQRGYDQVELIARHLSALRGYPVERIVARTHNETQHVLSRQERSEVALCSYGVRSGAHIKPGKVYMVLDDVITTGSTIKAVAQCIRDAGGTAWVAALAYQPRIST